MKYLLLLPLMAGLVSATPPAKPEGERCITRSLVSGPVVRDDQLIYFRGQPNPAKSYIVAFKGDTLTCFGMNRFSTVILDTAGAQYCNGDKIRGVTAPSTIPGPICVIDHFIPFNGDVGAPYPASAPTSPED